MQKTILCCLFLLAQCYADAQGKCPPNIGFELGDFTGWECSIGSISAANGAITLTQGYPVYGRQTMLSATNNSSQLDEFGGFPVTCPNGSGYSIKLGNAMTQAQAEQVSYTFTIPADQNNYSIVYHYAVVFQDPNHASWEQPKFTANVMDMTTGNYIGCSSFSYTASGSLPGFYQSFLRDSVFYKDWTPVTIKLSGMAGKTIRLEFTTNDCSKGGHFGYAYVDVNQNCTSPISGNVYCTASDKLTLVAPYGFSSYTWYTGDFSKQLGDSSKLVFTPPPPDQSRYALDIIPYPGQGCRDTLYTTVEFSPESLELKLAPHIDACVTTGADITAASVTAGSGTNLSFSYFLDEGQNKYVPNARQILKTGIYYVRAENVSGCTRMDSISVGIEPLPEITIADPATIYRPNTVDITKSVVPDSGMVYHYSFWMDSLLQKTISQPEAIAEKGRYFVKAQNTLVPECAVTKGINVKVLDPLIDAPNIFSPNGDGINDTWRITKLSYYPACIVDIYDRNGKKIFTSLPGYPNPWNGLYNNSPLPVGTYYYRIKLNEELDFVSGSVTIVR